MFWKLLLIFLCFSDESFAARRKWIPSYAGPYRIVVRNKFTNVSDGITSTNEIWTEIFPSHDKHLGEPQYFWGRTVQTITVDDNIQVNINIAMWSNNEWKRNAFVMKFPRACSDALQHAQPLTALLFNEDFRKCPLPPRDVIIKNHSAVLDFPTFRTFPYGRYRFTLVLFKKAVAIGVLVAEVDVLPKI